jgi:hypothetical protein
VKNAKEYSIDPYLYLPREKISSLIVKKLNTGLFPPTIFL